jgi:hypothetical protein
MQFKIENNPYTSEGGTVADYSTSWIILTFFIPPKGIMKNIYKLFWRFK